MHKLTKKIGKDILHLPKIKTSRERFPVYTHKKKEEKREKGKRIKTDEPVCRNIKKASPRRRSKGRLTAMRRVSHCKETGVSL